MPKSLSGWVTSSGIHFYGRSAVKEEIQSPHAKEEVMVADQQGHSLIESVNGFLSAIKLTAIFRRFYCHNRMTNGEQWP